MTASYWNILIAFGQDSFPWRTTLCPSSTVRVIGVASCESYSEDETFSERRVDKSRVVLCHHDASVW